MRFPNVHKLISFPDKEHLSRAAAIRFAFLSNRAKGRFTVALAGGSTPALLYSLLAKSPSVERVAWNRTHLFFGDERAVPPDSPDSNFRMAQETLLARIPLPAENVHRMPADFPDLDAAACAYEAEIRAVHATAAGEMPAFDLILLGLGGDGHCASLFPGKAALGEAERLVIPAEPGLKPFVPRLTFTFPLINHAKNILFLIAGADKAEAFAQVWEGESNPERYPAQSVQPASGTCFWFVDEAAQRLL
jgi:6-phosphogluconolactonase